MSDKSSVLFLCSGNTCRSQMAEGFLRRIANDRFEVFSAGLEPGKAVHPLAVRVMAEVGVDIAGQQPKSLKQFLGTRKIDWLIVVCEQAQRNCPKIWPTLHDNSRLFWPFPDPAAAQGTPEQQLKIFREVRDSIRTKLQFWLAAI